MAQKMAPASRWLLWIGGSIALCVVPHLSPSGVRLRSYLPAEDAASSFSHPTLARDRGGGASQARGTTRGEEDVAPPGVISLDDEPILVAPSSSAASAKPPRPSLSELAARNRDGASTQTRGQQPRHHGEWEPDFYFRRALAGPRRCLGAPCYIVDVIADPYQPRIFLSMLGLPATDMPRAKRGGVQNVTMVDIRSGAEVVMAQSYTLANETHGLALLLTGEGTHSNETRVVHCTNLKHQRATALNSYYESQTHACDLPGTFDLDGWGGGRPVRVDVALAPFDKARKDGRSYEMLNLNGEERPFHISSSGRLSEGLFNSVSRRSSPIPLSWNRPSNDAYPASTEKLTVSACLIGVDYHSPQQREVVQHYITMGFYHVYLGLNQWPTSKVFEETWRSLGDFVEDGSLSIIVSEYAAQPIQPEKFGENFTYAPQGHKSSFVNTCLLAARAAGDDMVGVFDVDEIIEHDYGNSTTIGEVLADQLKMRNLTLPNLCTINMGSVSAFYSNETAGYQTKGRIADKIEALAAGTDSVNKYGKSFHNARRVLRAGLHGPAYCESLPAPGAPADRTLPSEWRPRKGDPDIKPSEQNIDYEENNFRAERYPRPRALRILHLSDSFRWRSELKLEAMRRAKEGSAHQKMLYYKDYAKQVSYYVRDWSEKVHADLDRREQSRVQDG